jgi:hypothetical protein
MSAGAALQSRLLQLEAALAATTAGGNRGMHSLFPATAPPASYTSRSRRARLTAPATVCTCSLP